jgi:hypothetical protein
MNATAGTSSEAFCQDVSQLSYFTSGFFSRVWAHELRVYIEKTSLKNPIQEKISEYYNLLLESNSSIIQLRVALWTYKSYMFLWL